MVGMVSRASAICSVVYVRTAPVRQDQDAVGYAAEDGNAGQNAGTPAYDGIAVKLQKIQQQIPDSDIGDRKKRLLGAWARTAVNGKRRLKKKAETNRAQAQADNQNRTRR